MGARGLPSGNCDLLTFVPLHELAHCLQKMSQAGSGGITRWLQVGSSTNLAPGILAARKAALSKRDRRIVATVSARQESGT